MLSFFRENLRYRKQKTEKQPRVSTGITFVMILKQYMNTNISNKQLWKLIMS